MESRKLRAWSCLAVGLGLVSQAVNAKVALDPQSIDLEPFRLVPMVSAELRQDDNIYSLSSGEVDSLVAIISPSLVLAAQDRENSYTAQYALKAGLYDADGDDNYLDHIFKVNGHFEPSSRFRFDAGVGYSFLHDDRGTGFSSGQGLAFIQAMSGVDEYTLASLNGGVEYGAADAVGRVVLNGSFNQKRYDRDVVADVRDNDTLNSLLGFRFRLMPKTSLLLDYERVDTSYEGGVTPDTLDNRFLVGLQWENSAQTTGKLRIGDGRREVSGEEDRSSFTWDAGVVWSPLEYSSFTFDGGQRETDGDFPTVSIESKTFALGWNHDWSDRVSSRLSYSLGTDDHAVVTGNPSRSDDQTSISANVNYQMRRWLVFGAGLTSSERESNQSQFDNQRQIFSINAQVSL